MVPYAGLGLDRATDRREDPGWVAAQVADGRAREILEARWFTRDELKSEPGRVDAIDRVMLTAWVDEGDG